MPVIPKAFYWYSRSPEPCGGYIDRRDPCKDCPVWAPKDEPPLQIVRPEDDPLLTK